MRYARWIPVGLGVAVAAVAAARSANAQTLATDDPVLRRIWDEETTRSRLEPLAQALTDSIGPRLTGSPGIEGAQDWAVKQLKSWGVDARTEQYGTWEGWRRGTSHVDLVAPRVRSLEGRILAWSPGTGGRPVDAGVTYLPLVDSRADWEAFLSTVRGKWVMLSFPQPTCRSDQEWIQYQQQGSGTRMAQQRQAAEQRWNQSLRAAAGGDRSETDLHAELEVAGAAGIVTSDWPGTPGVTRIFDASNRLTPTFELSCEDYGLVYRLAANDQGPVVRLTAESENLGEVPVYNVVGEIPGTELPDQYVMLTAHLDSWDGSSGATDNGSGVVLMMEAMRVLTEVYPKPKRTLMIALWSGEEQGLNGSHAFVEDHPDIVAGLQALWNQDDGTGRIVNISAQGFVDAGGSIAKWLSQVPSEVSSYTDIELPGIPGSGSDYRSFVCAGAPGIPVGGISWDYGELTWHSNRDTYDKLVFDDLRNNAVLIASLAYLSAEDPAFTSRRKRTELPARNGRPGSWPTCTPAARHSPHAGS